LEIEKLPSCTSNFPPVLGGVRGGKIPVSPFLKGEWFALKLILIKLMELTRRILAVTLLLGEGGWEDWFLNLIPLAPFSKKGE
jgi:hypothetical protein